MHHKSFQKSSSREYTFNTLLEIAHEMFKIGLIFFTNISELFHAFNILQKEKYIPMNCYFLKSKFYISAKIV